MKRQVIVGLLMGMCCFHHSEGVTRYVWTNSPAPAVPYTTWETAAHTVQDAVSSAAAGDEVLVEDGHYDQEANITIAESIVLRSLNGPATTIIDGQDTVRCIYITGENVVVDGFTVEHGDPRNPLFPFMDGRGGGIYVLGSALLTNCVIQYCTSYNSMFP